MMRGEGSAGVMRMTVRRLSKEANDLDRVRTDEGLLLMGCLETKRFIIETYDVMASRLGEPGFVDGMVYDEEHGGYMCATGTKVAHPFSALHLALKVRLEIALMIDGERVGSE